MMFMYGIRGGVVCGVKERGMSFWVYNKIVLKMFDPIAERSLVHSCSLPLGIVVQDATPLPLSAL